MGTSPALDEADLHALVDNEISGEERRRVEDHLASCPEDAALVEGWRRQNAALRAAFEPVAQERPPLSLRNAAQRNAATSAPPIESGAIHWGRPSNSTRSLRRSEEAPAAARLDHWSPPRWRGDRRRGRLRADAPWRRPAGCARALLCGARRSRLS